MSDKIDLALSAEEWAKFEADYREDLATPREPYAKIHAWSIALANRRLPDSDPRKITRERVGRLRRMAESLGPDRMPGDYGAEVWQFIEGLEAYLPPE